MRPERVRAARELRGLTQHQVVAKMPRQITPAALSQIESGKVRPSPETLMALAEALEVPPGFFGLAWPDGADTVFFRDLRSTPVRERRRAAAQALLLRDLVAELEQRVRIPEVSVPVYDTGPGATRDALEEAAQALRGEWDLGEGPIPHVVRELERHGVPVVSFLAGSGAIDAFSVRFDKRPLILLNNAKSNYVRSRFDAAHELAHLVLHESATPGSKIVERQAHDFASSFLLPEQVALEILPNRIDTHAWLTLAEIKRQWGLSIAAILYRANALRILPTEAYRTALKYMSFRGWRKVEPGDREMGAPESPVLLERALRQAAVESDAPSNVVINHAQIPLSDTQKLISSAVDRRPIVNL